MKNGSTSAATKVSHQNDSVREALDIQLTLKQNAPFSINTPKIMDYGGVLFIQIKTYIL